LAKETFLLGSFARLIADFSGEHGFCSFDLLLAFGLDLVETNQAIPIQFHAFVRCFHSWMIPGGGLIPIFTPILTPIAARAIWLPELVCEDFTWLKPSNFPQSNPMRFVVDFI
jgi:hypothetical protein